MLTKEQVEYVAVLARLELSEAEKEKYAAQLSAILEYADALAQLETGNVPPTAHVLPLQNVFREDRVEEHLPPEKALANAPDKEGNSFRVPRII